MSNEPSASLAANKKKPNILWWLGGIIFLAFVWFLYQLFGPSPALIVSKETTYLTEPLRKDGLPDYEKYILDLSRDGVTPENNAAVLVARAMWPGSAYPKDARLIAVELGLDRSLIDVAKRLDEQSSWPKVSDWQKSLLSKPAVQATGDGEANIGTRSQEEADAGEPATLDPGIEEAIGPSSSYVFEIVGRAGSRPWTSEQIPPLAEWLKEHQQGLDMLVVASSRPRFYAPSPTLLDDDHQHGSLAARSLPIIEDAREAARCLAIRAMWHTGEGRLNDAWSDLMGLLRLSQLMEQEQSVVEKMIACHISAVAVDLVPYLFVASDLTVDQARRMRVDLATLPRFSTIWNALEFERLKALDKLLGFSQQRGSINTLNNDFIEGGNDSRLSMLSYTAVDWNAGLVEVNKWFDRGITASQIPDRNLRRKVLQQIDSELLAATGVYDSKTAWASAAISTSAKGQFAARHLLTWFLGLSFSTANNLQDRANVKLDLAQLAAALTVYRCEKGQYPSKLEDLVPNVLNESPVDLYNTIPFVYKREGDGYLLYSVGENGGDEGGSNSQASIWQGRGIDWLDAQQLDTLKAKIPAGADDISMRVPRPVFEMPQLPVVK